MHPPPVSNMEEGLPSKMATTPDAVKTPPQPAAAAAAGAGGISASLTCMVALEVALLRCLHQLDDGESLLPEDVAAEYQHMTGRTLEQPLDNDQMLAEWGGIYLAPGEGPGVPLTPLLAPAVLEQHLARLTAQDLPAAVAAAAAAGKTAATADNSEVIAAHTAAQLAGQAPGTWAHLSQAAALEAALLVVLHVASQQGRLLNQLGKGVAVTFQHMTQRSVDRTLQGQLLPMNQLLLDLFGGLYLAPQLPLTPRLDSNALLRQLRHVAARKAVLDAAAAAAAAAAVPPPPPPPPSAATAARRASGCVEPGTTEQQASWQEQQGPKRSREHAFGGLASKKLAAEGSSSGASDLPVPTPPPAAAAAGCEPSTPVVNVQRGCYSPSQAAGYLADHEEQPPPPPPPPPAPSASDVATTQQLPTHGSGGMRSGGTSSPSAARVASKRSRDQEAPVLGAPATLASAAASAAARRDDRPFTAAVAGGQGSVAIGAAAGRHELEAPAAKPQRRATDSSSRQRDTDRGGRQRDQGRPEQQERDQQKLEEHLAWQQELCSRTDLDRWLVKKAAGARSTGYRGRDDRRDQADRTHPRRAWTDAARGNRRRSRSRSSSSDGGRQRRTSAAAVGEERRSSRDVDRARFTAVGDDRAWREGSRSRRASSGADDRGFTDAASREESPRYWHGKRTSSSARPGSPAGDLSDGEVPSSPAAAAALGLPSAAQTGTTVGSCMLHSVPSRSIWPGGQVGGLPNTSSTTSSSKPHRPMVRLVPAGRGGTQAAGAVAAAAAAGRYHRGVDHGAAYAPGSWQQRLPSGAWQLPGEGRGGCGAVPGISSSCLDSMTPSAPASTAVGRTDWEQLLEGAGRGQPVREAVREPGPALPGRAGSSLDWYEADEIWKRVF